MASESMISPKRTEATGNMLSSIMRSVSTDLEDDGGKVDPNDQVLDTESDFIKKKKKKKEDRQKEMMRKLKLLQNEKMRAAEAETQEELDAHVNILEAGEFGTIHSEGHHKITAHIRTKHKLAECEAENSALNPQTMKKWLVSRAERLDVTRAIDKSYPDSDYTFKSPSEVGPIQYSRLVGPTVALPEFVNPRIREQYLSDKELCEVFGVSTREEFNALPKLKKNKLKQHKQLL